MGNVKYVDPRVLGSITSGTLLLPDFGKVHEALEWLMGHPIWTHELPKYCQGATELIDAQYPGMPHGAVANWEQTADFLLKKYGFLVPIIQGSAARDAGPVETLANVLQRP